MTNKHWEILEKILKRFPKANIIISAYKHGFTAQICIGNEGTNICSSATEEMGLDFTMEELTDFAVEEIKELYKEIK